MKYTKVKGLKGQEFTLLDLDNTLSPNDSISLFSGDDGRNAIEELIAQGRSNFSYAEDMLDEGPGYCVEFALSGAAPKSSEFRDCKDTYVRVTDVWEH